MSAAMSVHEESPLPLRADAPAPSPWIVSRGYDLAFFSTIWVPPLLVFAALREGGEIGVGFFSIWVYHLFIRLPHFAATMNATYLRRDERRYYREHWVLYYLVPAVILIVYGLLLMRPPLYPAPLARVLLGFAGLWGFHHISMQNYGILQLYHSRDRTCFDPAASRVEKIIFNAIVVCIFFNGAASDALSWSDDSIVAWTFSWGRYFFNGSLIALILFDLFRRASRGSLRSPGTLYFLVSLVVMYRWPLYDRLPEGCWFLVFNGHHSIAYLGLVFLMHWNATRRDTPLTLSSGVRAYARYLVPLVLISLAALLATAAYTSLTTSRFEVNLQSLTGFFVIHYYLESLVWKFSRKHNREATLPLLKQPPSRLVPAPAAALQTAAAD